MSNRRNFRHSEILKRRQQSFSLTQAVTNMIIPEYNALSDPFLCGFFVRPGYRKLLKTTGANQFNKANLIARFRASAQKTLNAHLSQDSPSYIRKTRSLSKKNKKQKESKLPLLEDVVTEELPTRAKSETGRYKKYYCSKNI